MNYFYLKKNSHKNAKILQKMEKYKVAHILNSLKFTQNFLFESEIGFLWNKQEFSMGLNDHQQQLFCV